jgi:prepilin-type processing-associated H-X9-DG protein
MWDSTLVTTGLVENSAVFTDPSDPPGTRSYAMNSALAGVKMGQLKGDTVVFFECAVGAPSAGGKELLPPQPRHHNRYNIGFADGSIRAVSPEEAATLRWNP